MRFRESVRAEFERRRRVNHRYSLRRFAAALGLYHATVSRLLRSARPAPAGTPGIVQLFVGVADVEGAVARGVKLGATVIVPPSVLPDGDVMAIVSDPSGITLGLMRHQAKP